MITGHTRRADDIDVNADEGGQVVCVRSAVVMSRNGWWQVEQMALLCKHTFSSSATALSVLIVAYKRFSFFNFFNSGAQHIFAVGLF
jgi:hypothetical protein